MACQAILDRAHGKPRAAEEKTSSLKERITQMTPQERRAQLAELTKEALQFLEQDGWRVVIEGEAADTTRPRGNSASAR